MTGAAHSPLVWPARVSHALDRAWKVGLCRRPSIEADQIIAAAVRREGATPADGAWRDRLGWLCTSLRDEAALNSLGRTIAHGQLVRIVAARIRAERLWRAHPEILERPIVAPVAIVGQMRSGTTRVHRLLACDPAFVDTRLFETLEPVPYSGWRRVADPRPAAALIGMAFLNRCNPALAPIHPTSPFAPEEEFGLHAFSLWGAQFEGQWHVPGYAQRCEQADATDVYAEFADLLRTIAWSRRDNPERRWLIKAPQFCQDITALIAQFPDVAIIRLIRREDEVVASSASLAWHHARIQSDRIDPAGIGAEWLRKTALRDAVVTQALSTRPALARIELDYDEVSAEWRASIRRLYAVLGADLTDSILGRMARLADRSRAHHGHRYSLGEFGLMIAPSGRRWPERVALQEAVGVDVDRDANLGRPIEAAEPIADDVLDVEFARRVDQQALAMAAAQHC